MGEVAVLTVELRVDGQHGGVGRRRGRWVK